MEVCLFKKHEQNTIGINILGYVISGTTYNQFHNILRIFDVLPNFPFSTSESHARLRISYKRGTYELPHELPNDIRLRILGN